MIMQAGIELLYIAAPSGVQASCVVRMQAVSGWVVLSRIIIHTLDLCSCTETGIHALFTHWKLVHIVAQLRQR